MQPVFLYRTAFFSSSHFPQWCLTLKFRKNKHKGEEVCWSTAPAFTTVCLKIDWAWINVFFKVGLRNLCISQTCNSRNYFFILSIFIKYLQCAIKTSSHFTHFWIKLYSLICRYRSVVKQVVYDSFHTCLTVLAGSFSCLSQVCSVNPTMMMSRCSALVWICRAKSRFNFLELDRNYSELTVVAPKAAPETHRWRWMAVKSLHPPKSATWASPFIPPSASRSHIKDISKTVPFLTSRTSHHADHQSHTAETHPGLLDFCPETVTVCPICPESSS